MTNPISLIKEGIESANWNKICKAYFILSGLKLKAPKPHNSVKIPKGLAPKILDAIQIIISGGIVEDVKDDDEEDIDDSWNEDIEEEEQQQAIRDVEDEQDEEEEDEQDIEEEEEEPEVEEVKRPPSAPLKQPAKAETPEEITDKFRIEHKGPSREDGRRTCKVLPFNTGKHKCGWKDKGTLATKDIKDSRALSKKKKPEQRRSAVKLVDVQCSVCDKKESVQPIFAPTISGDKVSYVCNSCIKRKGK